MRPENGELAWMVQKSCESKYTLLLQLFIMLCNAKFVQEYHHWFRNNASDTLPKAKHHGKNGQDTQLSPQFIREDLHRRQNAHGNACKTGAPECGPGVVDHHHRTQLVPTRCLPIMTQELIIIIQLFAEVIIGVVHLKHARIRGSKMLSPATQHYIQGHATQKLWFQFCTQLPGHWGWHVLVGEIQTGFFTRTISVSLSAT